jgi:uncharacterized protein (DUF1015 family)
VDRVAAPPYDVVTREEAAALAGGNPFSFLHVGRADIDVPAAVDPYDERVYLKARDNLRAFMTDGTLVQEREASLYLYELTQAGRAQVGVVGCVHIDDYERDAIRKHERTRPDKEADRTRHILVVNAHAEPVFLTHTGQPIIDQRNATEMQRPPLYDFTTADAVRHRVWRVMDPAGYLDAFRRMPAVYVADGHHRTASAWRAGAARRQANRSHTGEEEYNWFPAALFPASQVRILSYNRGVRDLKGLGAAAFLERLAALGRLGPAGSPHPERPGVICLYLAGRWHRLELDPASIDRADPIRSLDVQLLTDRVLGPLLGVGDVRTDPRIEFVGGTGSADELARGVDRGELAVGFSVYPVRVEQVMAIADGGGVMPPKSTWFEPKLRSGLFVHPLD